MVPGRAQHASHLRNQGASDTRLRALGDHRQRLILRTADVVQDPAVISLIRCGIESVIARRHIELGLGEFGDEMTARLHEAIRTCSNDHSPYARMIYANILMVNALDAERRGAFGDALHLAREARDADGANTESHLLIARILLGYGDYFGALQAAAAACDGSPYVTGSEPLTAQAVKGFLNSLTKE